MKMKIIKFTLIIDNIVINNLKDLKTVNLINFIGIEKS